MRLFLWTAGGTVVVIGLNNLIFTSVRYDSLINYVLAPIGITLMLTAAMTLALILIDWIVGVGRDVSLRSFEWRGDHVGGIVENAGRVAARSVTVSFYLLDQNNCQIAVASDHMRNLGAHSSWSFRATPGSPSTVVPSSVSVKLDKFRAW